MKIYIFSNGASSFLQCTYSHGHLQEMVKASSFVLHPERGANQLSYSLYFLSKDESLSSVSGYPSALRQEGENALL